MVGKIATGEIEDATVVGGYLSADELARFERLKAREREVLVVGELSDDLVADIHAAEYGVAAR